MKQWAHRTAGLAAVVACLGALPAQAQVAGAASSNGIQPTARNGNFVSENDVQVCYDLAALGFIGEVTSEMRGFKVDPPVNYSDGFVTFTVSGDKKFLDWSASGAEVLGVVVKGSNAYNVYNYVGTGLNADGLLHSPLKNGKVPQISHYNVCYREVPGGTQGCTRGYWRNHADRWIGAAACDSFNATFGVAAFNPDMSLAAALTTPVEGEQEIQLAAQATAALLNANAAGSVDYPLSAAQVKAIVQQAFAVQDNPDTVADEAEAAILAAKDLLDGYNNLGCPLGETKAVKVSCD